MGGKPTLVVFAVVHVRATIRKKCRAFVSLTICDAILLIANTRARNVTLADAELLISSPPQIAVVPTRCFNSVIALDKNFNLAEIRGRIQWKKSSARTAAPRHAA